jgi:hypothetical protein
MNLLGEAMKAQEQKSHSSKKKPTTSTKRGRIQYNPFFSTMQGGSRKLGDTKWLVKNN